MTEDSTLSNQLKNDRFQLEERVDQSDQSSNRLKRANRFASKFNRRLAYHQQRRGVWIMSALAITMLCVYPIVQPLFSAATNKGNLFATVLICLFLAALLAIFVVEKVEEQ